MAGGGMVWGLRMNLSRAAASYVKAVRYLSLFPFDEPSTFFLYPPMQVLSLFLHLQHPQSPSPWPWEASGCCPAVLPLSTLFAGSEQAFPALLTSSRQSGLGVKLCPQHVGEPEPSQSSSPQHCMSLWLLLCSITQPWHIMQIPGPLG